MLIQRALLPTIFLSCLPFAQADLIDFEAFTPGTTLGVVTTPTNSVTFSVGGASPTGPASVVGVGAPSQSFLPFDTPSGGSPGLVFLSDDLIGPSSGSSLNYFMVFSSPVSNLSLDAYDFGDFPVLGMVTLTTFTDAGFTNTNGSTTQPGSPLDGSVIPLTVSSDSVLSASLVFAGGDPGIGIDNVSFDTTAVVPEPTTVTMLCAGLLALGWMRRRR